jgi:hypothetical protein
MFTEIVPENEVKVLTILVKKGKSLIGKDFSEDDYNSLVEKLIRSNLYMESEVNDNANNTETRT